MAITKYTEIITQTIEKLVPQMSTQIDTSVLATKNDINNVLGALKVIATTVQNIEKTLNEFKKKTEQ